MPSLLFFLLLAGGACWNGRTLTAFLGSLGPGEVEETKGEVACSRFDMDFGFGCTGGGACFGVAGFAFPPSPLCSFVFRCCEAANAMPGGITETAPGGSLMPLNVVGAGGGNTGTAPGGSLAPPEAVVGVSDGFVVGIVCMAGENTDTAPGGSLTPLFVVSAVAGVPGDGLTAPFENSSLSPSFVVGVAFLKGVAMGGSFISGAICGS